MTQDLSSSSDTEIELQILPIDEVHSDQEPPRVQPKQPQSPFPRTPKTTLSNQQKRSRRNQRNEILKEIRERSQREREATEGGGRYKAMVRRLEARNIWFNDSKRAFRFNVNLERRYFLNLIQNTRLVGKKEKRLFLEEEEKKDEIIFAQNCVECGAVNYLPSFQLLR